LIAFPPHANITKIVCSKDVSTETAFPQTSQFKILYSVYALKLCLVHQLRNVSICPRKLRAMTLTNVLQGTTNEAFVCHGVQLLALTLTGAGKTSTSIDAGTDVSTAVGLVDCLLTFLKGSYPCQVFSRSNVNTFHFIEAVSPEVSSTFFSDEAALVERLLSFITFAQSGTNSNLGIELVRKSFAVILEASLHCSKVWIYFKRTDQSSIPLQHLLIEDTRQEIRQGVADSIRGICCSLPT